MKHIDLNYLEIDLLKIIEGVMEHGVIKSDTELSLFERIFSEIEVLNQLPTDQNIKSDFEDLLDETTEENLEKLINEIKATDLDKIENSNFIKNILKAYKITYLLIGKILYSN
jgi:predicted metalloendopeptidase